MTRKQKQYVIKSWKNFVTYSVWKIQWNQKHTTQKFISVSLISFSQIKHHHIKLLIIQKQFYWFDWIPPELVKLAAIPFYKTLAETINFSTKHSIFPDCVAPLDKGKPNKKETSNCWNVSILNIFFKDLQLSNETINNSYHLIEKCVVLSMPSIAWNCPNTGFFLVRVLPFPVQLFCILL